MTDDTLVNFGSEIKAMGETADAYKFGGWLVVFDKHDASNLKDKFTANTDFDIEDGDRRSVYYNHGLDGTIKRTKLGSAILEVKDAGVWITGEIKKRNDYLKAHAEHIAQNIKLFGLSSGAPAHLVEREKSGDGHEVKMWPIAEASITPTPAEPLTGCISLKSLIDIEAAEEIKKYDPRQPRDDLGKWSTSSGGISVGHAIHVMKSEGITDEKHHAAVREAIENGTHKTREDVLKHIDVIHAQNGTKPPESKPSRDSFTVDRVGSGDHTFQRGEKVAAWMGNQEGHKVGELVGISHANGTARVKFNDGVRGSYEMEFPHGAIYKHQEPSIVATQPTGATAGNILGRANHRGALGAGEEWADADRVPTAPAVQPLALNSKDPSHHEVARMLHSHQEVTIDGTTGTVAKITKQTRSAPTFSDDPNSLDQGERKYDVTTVTLRHRNGQESRHTFGGIDAPRAQTVGNEVTAHQVTDHLMPPDKVNYTNSGGHAIHKAVVKNDRGEEFTVSVRQNQGKFGENARRDVVFASNDINKPPVFRKMGRSELREAARNWNVLRTERTHSSHEYRKSLDEFGISDESDEPIINDESLKSHNFTSPDEVVTAITDILRGRMPLEWHSQAVRATVKSLEERIAGVIDTRCVKSGRVLSCDNHERLSQHHAALQAVVEDLGALLEAHKPAADDTDTKALSDVEAQQLMARYVATMARLNGIPLDGVPLELAA